MQSHASAPTTHTQRNRYGKATPVTRAEPTKAARVSRRVVMHRTSSLVQRRRQAHRVAATRPNSAHGMGRSSLESPPVIHVGGSDRARPTTRAPTAQPTGVSSPWRAKSMIWPRLPGEWVNCSMIGGIQQHEADADGDEGGEPVVAAVGPPPATEAEAHDPDAEQHRHRRPGQHVALHGEAAGDHQHHGGDPVAERRAPGGDGGGEQRDDQRVRVPRVDEPRGVEAADQQGQHDGGERQPAAPGPRRHPEGADDRPPCWRRERRAAGRGRRRR